MSELRNSDRRFDHELQQWIFQRGDRWLSECLLLANVPYPSVPNFEVQIHAESQFFVIESIRLYYKIEGVFLEFESSCCPEWVKISHEGVDLGSQNLSDFVLQTPILAVSLDGPFKTTAGNSTKIFAFQILFRLCKEGDRDES